MITVYQVGIDERIVQCNKTIFIQVMSSLYYHAYSFRNFTGQIWYMFFLIKFIINVYAKKFGILDLCNRVAIDFYI